MWILATLALWVACIKLEETQEGYRDDAAPARERGYKRKGSSNWWKGNR